jgi:uncharacterized protein YlxW (UPF0749 family)
MFSFIINHPTLFGIGILLIIVSFALIKQKKFISQIHNYGSPDYYIKTKHAQESEIESIKNELEKLKAENEKLKKEINSKNTTSREIANGYILGKIKLNLISFLIIFLIGLIAAFFT